jgi:hypothetical protein
MLSILVVTVWMGGALGACTFNGSHLHDDSDNGHWHLVWATSECKVKWTADGDVSYTKDGRDIDRLSPGGMLTVVEEYGPHTRRVELTQKSGTLDRTYLVDGTVKPWDQYAADWFAELLVQVDHTTGALADVRFPRLMESGGATAVLNDMAQASDRTKRTYMQKLAASSKLTADQSCQLAGVAEHMNSDYDKAALLVDAVGQVNFASQACREAFFDAVNSIASDYEKSRVLIAAVEHGPMSGPGFDGFTIAAIHAARSITSDHDKAHVLVSVASRCSAADTVRTAYLATARTIASDAERARALTALVRQQ